MKEPERTVYLRRGNIITEEVLRKIEERERKKRLSLATYETLKLEKLRESEKQEIN